MSAAPLKIRRERQLIRSIGSGSNAVTEDMRRLENVEEHSYTAGLCITAVC